MRSSHNLDCPQGIPGGWGEDGAIFPKAKRPKALGIINSIQVVLGQDYPLNDNDLSEFLELAASSAESEKSWASTL